MIPSDKESRELLTNLKNLKAVAPLDIALKIDRLHFKISADMMLEIAYWAVKLSSYQDAEDYFKRAHKIIISDGTIRKVVNLIGESVFNSDCETAKSIQ